MMVKVRKAHITWGRSGSCENCPIALALKTKFKKAEYVSVDTGVIYIDQKTYSTPAKVAAFIERFDWSRPVKPFEFQMPRAH